jgi:hypothetical protein
MEETLEGGRGPPRSVAPLERERDIGYLDDKAERLRRGMYTGVGGVPEEKMTLGGYRIMFKDMMNMDHKETRSKDSKLIAMKA